jgi:uncharacterized membrane protein YccC
VIQNTITQIKITLSKGTKGILEKLSPLSTQLAIKTCLAIVIGQALALWLSWSATIVAVTILMLQTRYLGSTLDKSILRFAGGLGGAVVALVVMALFPQDRFLFIGTIALLTIIGIYIQQGSRYPYAWLIGIVSLCLVAFLNISKQNPYGTFEFAIMWTSSIALAVVVLFLVHGLLWPNPAGKDFELGLKSVLENSRELLSLKVRAVFEDQPYLHETATIEKGLIMLLPKLRTTLATAALDTGRFHNHQQKYNDLLDQLGTLVELIVVFGATISVCRESSSLESTLAGSNSFRSEVRTLENMLDDVVTALTKDRSGTVEPAVTNYQNEIDGKIKVLVADLNPHIHNVKEFSVLAAMISKFKELAYHIVDFRISLANVENQKIKESPQASPQTLPELQTSFSLKSLRFRKAAIGGIVVVMACTLWITTNWPYPYKMIVFAVVPMLINAMVPWLPPRPLLKSLVWGGIVGFVLYFGIMPLFTGYLQLAPVLIIAFFPFCYFMNSSRPTTAAMSMFSGLWVIELISVSQPQSYSFTDFMNNFIGFSGGFGLAFLTLAIFSPRVPEKEFRRQLSSFFETCEKIIKELEEHKPWTADGKSILISRNKKLIDHIKLCGMWSTMLNYDRVASNDKNKIDSLLVAIGVLAFRLKSFEHARRVFKDESLLVSLKDKAQELRQAVIETFSSFKSSISKGEHVPELPDISNLKNNIRADLEDLGEQAQADENVRELAGQVMVVLEFYPALTESLHECRQRVNALDWKAWDQAYFQ